MSDHGLIRTYDLTGVAEAGIRALVEALHLDCGNVRRIEHRAAAASLELELADPASAERTDAFVRAMLRTHRRIARKVVAQHRAARRLSVDVDTALRTSTDVAFLGPGLTGLRGSLLALFRFFEGRFLRLAREFDAEENHYPAMIPAEIIAEVGYFQHFPQHVTVCCHLPDSLPLLEAAAAQSTAEGGGLPARLGSELAAPAHVLTPGVCIPCYRQLRHVTLGAGEVRTLTMQNQVFRYEGANFRPLSRGWAFTVRDIVFFGTYEAMQRRREAVMARTMDLCRELDLEVTIELANDPFFLDASRDKAIYQRMGEVKYELLAHLPIRGESLAISSFNLHRDFYTKVYQTRDPRGALAESACMGFGIDRWVYAFLSQKGLDPAHWPAVILAKA